MSECPKIILVGETSNFEAKKYSLNHNAGITRLQLN